MLSSYKNYKICHEHYTEDQYSVNEDGSRKLIPGSRPSQNLPKPRQLSAGL